MRKGMKESSDIIKIKNLEVFSRIGVLKEENVLGQKFLISVNMYTDMSEAASGDDIEKTVNYAEVCNCIYEYMKDNTAKLIEKAATDIAELILIRFEHVFRAEVEVSKPGAPVSMHFENISVAVSRQWHRAYLSIGSNMGDRKAYLDYAVEQIKNESRCRIRSISDYIETAPYGYTEQPDFLNACIGIDTMMNPHELLMFIGKVENGADRERDIHWGPRTLDLDILLFDDLMIADERLVIPHPEMDRRTFVLGPLAEIAPYEVHPVFGKHIIRMYEDLVSNENSKS